MQVNNANSLPSSDHGLWSIAQAVRTQDETRIKSAKEEIDILILIAGLFSAIQTAFLMETHKPLQRDATGIMLVKFYLEMQYQNSPGDEVTFHPTIESPFLYDPHPLNHKRLNTLCVASLITSLITASLAILLKQWLHQYQITNHLSPQRWLRTYFYRLCGAERWKVFKVIYILPILLQFSLGLFLIGLCLFFSHGDHQVGLTGWIVVSLWASAISFAMITPILDPSSPFNTISLHGITSSLRSLLPAVFAFRFVTSSVKHPADASIFAKGQNIFEEPFEEEYFANNATIVQDHEILLAIDAILDHDDAIVPYLMMALHDVEKQARFELVACLEVHTLSFLTRFIGSRLKINSVNLRVCRPYLGEHLSLSTWTAIVDTVSGLLVSRLLNYDDRSRQMRWEGWMEDAITLLLSRTRYPLPSSGCEALALALKIDPIGSAQRICVRIPFPEWVSSQGRGYVKYDVDLFTELVHQDLRGVLELLSGQTLADAVLQLLRARYLDSESCSFEEFFKLNPVEHQITRIPRQGATPVRFWITLCGTFHLTLSLLIKSIETAITNTGNQGVQWHYLPCSFVLRNPSFWAKEHYDAVRLWFMHRPSLDNCLQMAFPENHADKPGVNNISFVLPRVYDLTMRDDDRYSMIKLTTNILREHYVVQSFTGSSNTKIGYLRLMRFLLQCAIRDQEQTKILAKAWGGLYSALNTLLSLDLRHSKDALDHTLVQECIELTKHPIVSSAFTFSLSIKYCPTRKAIIRLRSLIKQKSMTVSDEGFVIADL